MERVGKLRASLLVAFAIAAGLTVTLLLVTRSSNASGGSALVKTAHNATLGRTILVTRSGLTLYSLSAERHGRFICTTGACLSIWKPLIVARGVTPTGVKGLGVVRRPDMRRQVAFRGAPLYRFAEDTKPGQVKGNGFKDVGVWRPVTTGSKTAAPATPAPTPSNSYGY
jgi:predicted lipoprotein with Yx(FWY)xxD motif